MKTNNVFIILLMLFLHIVDDYYLQAGLLSKLKQKNWWTSQKEYKEMYKYDYLIGLLMHSYSWAFMIMLPIAFKMNFDISTFFIITLIINGIIHFIVDDLKANKGKINLVIDQSIHIVQIIVTAIILL